MARNQLGTKTEHKQFLQFYEVPQAIRHLQLFNCPHAVFPVQLNVVADGRSQTFEPNYIEPPSQLHTAVRDFSFVLHLALPSV